MSPRLRDNPRVSHPPCSLTKLGRIGHGQENSLNIVHVSLGHRELYISTSRTRLKDHIVYKASKNNLLLEIQDYLNFLETMYRLDINLPLQKQYGSYFAMT